MFLEKEKLQRYAVRVPLQASSCIAFAADMLKKYIVKMTSIKLSEVGEQYFSLGETEEYLALTEKPDLSLLANDDGFFIFEKSDNIFFVAKTDRGVLYAVYEYLETFCGCRFFTETCEKVPMLEKLPMPEMYQYTPPLRMRTYLCADTYDEFRKDERPNSLWEHLVRTHIRDVYTRIDEEHGGPIEVYGRHGSHNFRFYVPYEKYGESHPEFFQEIDANGTRMLTIDIANGILPNGELDESQEISVAKVVIEEMKKDILAMPHVKVFMLTQEDSNTEYFVDDNNRRLEEKYKRSGILIRFCNVVARELNKWSAKELNGRVIKIGTFAYAYTKEAPVKEEDGRLMPIDETVISDENVIVQMALFSNGYYSYFSKKQLPEVLRQMSEWRTVAKHFWFWGYDTDFTNYYAFYDSFGAVKENVEGFIEYGMDYVAMQGTYDCRNNWQGQLRGYLYHRLMWNPSLDVQELMDEYLAGYYGIASDCIKRFIDLYHQNYLECEEKGISFSCETWGSHTYVKCNPKEMLLKAVQIVEEGEALIREDKNLSDVEKEIYLKRLSAVKTTPLNVLFINFKEYNPEGTKEAYERVKADFIKASEFADISLAREGMKLSAYVDFVESDDYIIRPICRR